jgi:hypothetical protein
VKKEKKTSAKVAAPKKVPTKKKARKASRKKGMPELCIFQTCAPEDRKFQGLCRKCYMTNWKVIKGQAQEKAQRRLNAYVERITQKYPEDYLERIRDGLENEEIFNKMVAELELDQDGEPETEREFIEKFSRKIRSED